MTSLGYSPVSNNQILQPNIAGGANPSGAHFAGPYPQFSSIVGGVSGCGGAGGSAAALAAKPGYNVVVKQHGGKNGSHRRGGNKRSGHKKHSHKRSHNKRSHKKHSHKRSHNKRSGHKKHSHKRSMSGGLSALSPTPFSGAANAPYHQFMSNQPASYVYGLGVDAPIPPSDSWMASPPPMNNVHNRCDTK